MSKSKLKIAIISDMHCHPNRENGNNSTHLLTDKLRTPAKGHPVESLLETIKNENLNVDLVLCPGDFTDKADKAGLIFGWNSALEIGRALKAEKVIATLGNHDVDSRNKENTYSFEMAKGIKQGFPISDETNGKELLNDGLTFIETDIYLILVLNSVYFHHNKVESIRGRISSDQLESIEKKLLNKQSNKIKIALVHHHPIIHSRFDLGENDVIEKGSDLLAILTKNSFDILIHGHKHDPWLRKHTTESPFEIPIFSSGSFSATTNLMFTGKRNNFHVLEIEKNTSKTESATGKIQTFTFLPKSGWDLIQDEHDFPTYTGFGFDGKISDLGDKIKNYIGNKIIINWSDVIMNFPSIENLTPMEANELNIFLRENGLFPDKKISERPEIISNRNYKKAKL